MPVSNLVVFRRRLAGQGLTPASAVPESTVKRAEETAISPARLVEDAELRAHPIGSPEPWPDPVAFLNGIQRMHLVAYAGAAPVYLAEIAGAVRERRESRLTTALEERRQLVIGRPSALAEAGDAVDGITTLALPEDEPPHPVRDLAQASRALDRARGQLELDLGRRFRRGSDAWLLVDGSLAESPEWATDPRAVGISRGHGTLPFDGDNLNNYLRLPAGHRTSIFAPQTRRVAPVHAWGLRLWDWTGKDFFHGLVRVEVAPGNGVPAMADVISSRLLAERVPLTAPDPRWDRLLYGMHSVEQYLRARAGALA